MKAKDVPQEEWIKGYGTRACYAEDENGKYVVVQSKGWEVEKIVNSQAHNVIKNRIEEAKKEVEQGKASPLRYYMEINQMDLSLLASNAGIWKWRVKRHLKAEVFRRLNRSTLQKYAHALRISVNELLNLPKSDPAP
ncbi:MAG: helix-turn-helix transcriptional regulator [Deltaproteobacteria bacterium]|nr:helix-turn-helix transcriptional regulator [Deltaproteobacteria bacterium]